MELRLAHGRSHPHDEVNDSEYPALTLFDVESVEQMYEDTITVRFTSNKARDTAFELTGWHIWDEITLEIIRRAELIETHPPNGPSRYFGNQLLCQRDAMADVANASFLVQRARTKVEEALESLSRLP